MKKKEPNIRKELEQLSPFLLKMKEEAGTPFQAPEAYFQGLPDDVLRRVKAEEGLIREPVAARRRPWLPGFLEALLRPRLAIGLASAALLLAAGLYFFGGQAPAEGGTTLASVSDEEIEAYITNHIESFDIELMLEASVVSADEVEAIDVFSGLDEEELDQYLDELMEDIKLEELEELL